MTAAQSARAAGAHQATRDAQGRTDAEVRALLLTQAQTALGVAQTLSQQTAGTALGNAGIILGGAAQALAAAGAPTSGNPLGDPRLVQAAGVITNLAAGAAIVNAAIQGGTSVPLALATAAAGFIPNSDARTLALNVLQAVSFAQQSEQPALTAAQGILSSLLTYAAGHAEREATLNPPVTPEQARARTAQGLVLPFLGGLIGSLSDDPLKYVPGATLQLAIDLRHAALEQGEAQ